MKYVRTPKNEIFEFIYPNESGIYTVTKFFQRHYIEKSKHMKQADAIEELYDIDDLLVVSNGQSKMSIIVESLDYTKSWLKTHDIYKIIEFYIKNENDYKCVAKANEKGELELLWN